MKTTPAVGDSSVSGQEPDCKASRRAVEISELHIRLFVLVARIMQN